MCPGGYSILVVDDNVDTCRTLGDILAASGYRVVLAHNGVAALELLRDHAPAVALLDLWMPGMNGMTLSRELTRLRPATVILMVTGNPEDVFPEEARAAGVRQVFRKPVNLPRLLARVKEEIGG